MRYARCSQLAINSKRPAPVRDQAHFVRIRNLCLVRVDKSSHGVLGLPHILADFGEVARPLMHIPASPPWD